MTTPNMSGLTPWKAVAAAYMRMRALAQYPYTPRVGVETTMHDGWAHLKR